MGCKHGLNSPVLALLACCMFAACSHRREDEDDKRRALLTPQDLPAKRDTAREAARLFDAAGNLIPSETKVAGLLVPRGMTLVVAPEHEWYFDGPLPLPKLEKYLREHLEIHDEDHSIPGRIDFAESRPRDTPAPTPTFVSFYPKPGRPELSQLYIHEYVPRHQHLCPAAAAQAQMAARKAHAD
jgi:hypothetical protein